MADNRHESRDACTGRYCEEDNPQAIVKRGELNGLATAENLAKWSELAAKNSKVAKR